MAKNYVFNRVMNDRFNIKGELSADGTTVTYINSDKEEATIPVAKILEPFKGEAITLTISVKTDQDLSDVIEGE